MIGSIDRIRLPLTACTGWFSATVSLARRDRAQLTKDVTTEGTSHRENRDVKYCMYI